MQFSHSRAETFETCPYRYKLRYVDKLEVLPNDDPANALFLGTALHEGIEKGVRHGIKTYFDSYPVITDSHINESMKLEYWIPKVQNMIDELAEGKPVFFEKMISTSDLIGFMDLLIEVEPNVYDLYDFKYSNSVDRYCESRQLHEYKYFFEKMHPYAKIRKMGFIFIPKTSIRQKKTEDLFQFRQRLKETLEGMEIKTVSINYDLTKVVDFYAVIKQIYETQSFEKKECKLCNFCDFQEFCTEGVDYMILPKNERREISANGKKKVWLYGAPFSGKTTLADAFPNPIMLNTDGNLNSFTAPYVEVRETLEGRQKISAWENFKSAIDELQKGSEYETIVVDLIEDCYEHCRRWCYTKLGIEHESDNSFKAWDFVRNEFLTTVKKLMTLDYNVVLISHEDLSKDITKKTGDKITAIRPNINDKTANKLAGMVDIVARVVADGDNDRTLQFKSDDVVFGGGRLKLTHTVIPLTFEALEKVYAESAEMKRGKNGETAKKEEPKNDETPAQPEAPAPVVEEDEPTATNEDHHEVADTEEQPVRRRRGRPRKVETEEPKEAEAKEPEAPRQGESEEPAIEQPVRRRRRVVEE